MSRASSAASTTAGWCRTPRLIGALLVVLADVVGRVIVRPGELQVGIVMALIGGPVFVLLVRRVRLVKL